MRRSSRDTDNLKQQNLEEFGMKIKKYRKTAGMTAEDIREFCRKVIEERGRFANVAEECLRHQKDPNQ